MFYFRRLVFFAFLAVAALGNEAAAEMQPAEFTAASYNLRQANASDSLAGNGWGRRLPVLAELIRFHGFDIFGTQEGYKHQLDSLLARLPGYAYTGIGRDDGKDAGEHSAIFYRTDIFELLDHGDFWLSETPGCPGLGWDAVCPRICSWGKFVHNPSGQVFVFMNLHMDHVGKQARVEAAKLVKERIASVAGGEPVIVTGDFNVDQTHGSYRTMLEGGRLSDSYDVAGIRYAPNGTFNSYHTDDFSTSRIDHVFVSPGIEVRKYGVLTDTYRTNDAGDEAEMSVLEAAPDGIEARKYVARTPSDHFPVMVELQLPKAPGFVSLRDVFDRLALNSAFIIPSNVKDVFRSIHLERFKGKALVCGNASPRSALLEAVSVIPGERAIFNSRDKRGKICRIYYNPVPDGSGRGEALIFVVGHGGNDTVVLYMPDVKKSELMNVTDR